MSCYTTDQQNSERLLFEEEALFAKTIYGKEKF